MSKTPHYLLPKSEIFFRGRELLEPNEFSEFLHPACHQLEPISDSALSYMPEGSSNPGFPANPRMFLARLYLQLGVYMDHYTGFHEPSISTALRELTASAAAEDIEALRVRDLIPAEHLPLFPQLAVTSKWPPTFLVHGSSDTAVLPGESDHMHTLLQNAGIDVILRIIKGEEHSFDYQKRAEELYGGEGGLFDEVVTFLIGHLKEPERT